MPGIHTLGQPGLQTFQREQLESGPLGRVGNLSFKAESGATPRASSPNALQRFGQFLSSTLFRMTASPEQRAQQQVLDQARDNSRRVGDLLGHLTAPQGDAKAQQKLAQSLVQLGERAGGDLATLPGGGQALNTYLAELTVMDVNALRGGVLANPEARQNLLASIEPPELRAQAESVLTQISDAVNQQVGQRTFSEPLANVNRLLAGKDIDGPALEAELGKLADHAALFGGDLLDAHTQNLSDKSLGALYLLLQGPKADTARQALAQIKDMNAEQVKRSETMLERLRETVDKAAQIRVEQRLTTGMTAFNAAVAEGNRIAIGDNLIGLATLVSTLRENFGAELPESGKAILQASMSATMEVLRDKEKNPDGPLNRDSLRQLDDNTLGTVRRSGAVLRNYGLSCSKPDALAETEFRLRDLDRNAIGSVVDVLNTLALDEVPPHTLVSQLRELCDLEFQRTQLFAQLGNYGERVDIDGRRKSMLALMENAIGQLREQGRDDVANRAANRLDLLQGLSEQYSLAIFGMAVMGGGEYGKGMEELIKPIKTMEAVLSGLSEALLPEGKTYKDIEVAHLSPEYEQALTGQFGVRFDPETRESTLDLTDAMRARMAPFMDMAPVPRGAPQTVTLPVRGVDTEFSVSQEFYVDAIQRPSISLSVHGASVEDSTPVRSTWPRDLPDDGYDASMGEALDALRRVGGDSTEALTRLMTQELGANMVLALKEMGNGSPFKLDDGTVVDPNGAGHFNFDLEKNTDGSFRLGATLRIPMRHVSRPDAPVGEDPKILKPDTSWVEVHVMLGVTPDGKKTQLIEPPRFASHFEVMPD